MSSPRAGTLHDCCPVRGGHAGKERGIHIHELLCCMCWEPTRWDGQAFSRIRACLSAGDACLLATCRELPPLHSAWVRCLFGFLLQADEYVTCRSPLRAREIGGGCTRTLERRRMYLVTVDEASRATLMSVCLACTVDGYKHL